MIKLMEVIMLYIFNIPRDFIRLNNFSYIFYFYNRDVITKTFEFQKLITTKLTKFIFFYHLKNSGWPDSNPNNNTHNYEPFTTSVGGSN